MARNRLIVQQLKAVFFFVLRHLPLLFVFFVAIDARERAFCGSLGTSESIPSKSMEYDGTGNATENGSDVSALILDLCVRT